MNKTPIFILGAPRSGTTFLASLLRPTSYGAPFETHFITKYYNKLNEYGELTNISNFTRLLEDICKERPVMQWNLNVDPVQFFQELGGDFAYADIANKLCMMAAVKKGYRGWGDKTPSYLGELEVIDSLFPDAKYFYIVRDGRDVALSLLEKDWGPNNIYSCAEYWKLLNVESDVLGKLKAEGRVFELRYEDLLDEISAATKEIYEFLKEDYDNEKINQVTSKVKKGNYYKWRSLMRPKQIELFERVAASTLERLGYDTAYEERSIGALSRVCYKIHNLIFRMKHLFVVNVIDTVKIRFFGKEPFVG